MYEISLDTINPPKETSKITSNLSENASPTKYPLKGSESNSILTNKEKEDLENEPRQIWFCQLFRFATTFDYVLMSIGSIAAIGMGTAMPSFAYIWGNMTDSFASGDMVSASRDTMKTFIYVGIGSFFAGWLMFSCWMIAGERQAISCRKAYLRSLLRQEIGWFDMLNQTELASRFAKDTFAFQGAIGEKISTLIMTLGTLVAGFVFAFITGWLMTLVVMACLPVMAIAGIIFVKSIGLKDEEQQSIYSQAGGLAEQALSSIKTVKQLNGEEFEREKYSEKLESALAKTCKLSLFASIGMALVFFAMLASYSFGFWYGSKCVLDTHDCPSYISKQKYTAGNVLVVFFSILMAGFNLSQVTPAFKKITEGRQAAARIFDVIDREPKIKNPTNGIKLEKVKGVIRFENVTFRYPRDPSRIVFDNISLEFDINKTGLVGESGCGKSTALQLIMRFYDPDQGRVTLDGHDLKTLDLIWLRKNIGYVGQEPVLFATSIKENLLFGNEEASDEEIVNALKMAEAFNFVEQLENKIETYVGFGGGQLSGGQKQRIAIARAILRKPKIMLLDEATSALDRRNEKLIQKTLEKVTENMTTITVAHRVKTIMNSDMIYVLDKGGVLEKGKFKEIKMFQNSHHELDQEEDNDLVKNEENQNANENEVDKDKTKLELKKEDAAIIGKTKEELEKEETERLVEKYDKSIFGRIFSYSTEKLPYFILGILVSLANGVIFPIFSIFLSRMLTALLAVGIDNSNQTEVNNINFYALIFLILAIITFVLTSVQMFVFDYVGTSITRKIREETYYKILRMPIKWFDIPKNNAGTLSARLSTDCQVVNEMTTGIVQIMIQNVSTLVTGIIIAFVFEWRTSLVALGLLPLMIIAGAIQMQLNTGFSDQTDAAYKDSSSLIMEAMINIRTVSSFGYEGIIAKKYDEKMEEPYKLAVKKGNASGFFFGISQLTMFIIFGLLFFIGAVFVRDNSDVTVTDMFTAVYAIMFAGMTAGNNAHFMPDSAACKNSAANLFQILDSQDEEQLQIEQKSKMLTSGIENGDIEIDNISFKYETRNEYVFKNLSLKIKNGTKVAFVGPSGCGKSTILQLIQRFYDIQEDSEDSKKSGSIKINGINIKDFDIHYLRKCFGVVSQEPVLFNGSFRENILYNLDSNKVSENDIRVAAQKANALNFIIGNEEADNNNKQDAKNSSIQNDMQQSVNSGFDRDVGVKGSHISGGQKQRVAVARAILRNPSKLLLDEATSALDRVNEKKVQDSLDEIMIGKTVISVAHRIETIKNSDCIFVFEKGEIVESGNYSELVNKKGYFYNLERGNQFT